MASTSLRPRLCRGVLVIGQWRIVLQISSRVVYENGGGWVAGGCGPRQGGLECAIIQGRENTGAVLMQLQEHIGRGQERTKVRRRKRGLREMDREPERREAREGGQPRGKRKLIATN